MRTRRMFLASLVFAAAFGNVTIAAEQIYPSRPITMIVPFAAGGPTDTIARILAEHLRGSLGHPVILENVTGAAGSIGAGRVAHAAGDGYTLVIGVWGTHVLNGAIYGLASHGRLLGAFKPGNRSRQVGGLYLAGGAAHPGPGMPMVLMSGWIAADALDQDLRQRTAA